MNLDSILHIIENENVNDYRLNHFTSEIRQELIEVFAYIDEQKKLYYNINMSSFYEIFEKELNIPVGTDSPYFIKELEANIRNYYYRNVENKLFSLNQRIKNYYKLEYNNIKLLFNESIFSKISMSLYLDIIYQQIGVNNINEAREKEVVDFFERIFIIEKYEDDNCFVILKNNTWSKNFLTTQTDYKESLTNPNKIYFQFDSYLKTIMDYISIICYKQNINLDYEKYVEKLYYTTRYGNIEEKGCALPKSTEYNDLRVSLFKDKIVVKIKNNNFLYEKLNIENG